MMPNDLGGVEMWPVAKRMAVRDRDNVMAVGNRRAHRRLQPRLQIGAGKGIVEALADDDVGAIAAQFGKQLPAGRLWSEIVAVGAAVLDENHAARALADSRCEIIDAPDDTGEVVLSVALEQAYLHVDHQ